APNRCLPRVCRTAAATVRRFRPRATISNSDLFTRRSDPIHCSGHAAWCAERWLPVFGSYGTTPAGDSDCSTAAVAGDAALAVSAVGALAACTGLGTGHNQSRVRAPAL